MKKHLKLLFVISALVLTALLIFTSCQGEETAKPTATAVVNPTVTVVPTVTEVGTATEVPAATESPVTSVTPTLQLEFPDFEPAPDGVKGEDSLTSLVEDVRRRMPIETKDFFIQTSGGPADDPRLYIEVRIKKEGGWKNNPEDERLFRQEQAAFLAWVAKLRNLSGQDCLYFTFTIPDNPENTMTFKHLDRNLNCP